LKFAQYMVVDPHTGEIESTGFCQECDLDAQPVLGPRIKLVGCGTTATHYYTSLGLREYTPEQRAAKSQQQPHSRWDNSLMQWIDVRPVSELRTERWARIKAARTAALDAPIDTPWGRFDANAPSRAALAEAAAAQDPDDTIAWTRADNTVAALPRSALAELLRLIDRRTQQAHAMARVLRSRIEAASDVIDLEVITWPQAP
jgi:hypothetical protein